MSEIAGVFNIMATPFDEELNIDIKSLRQLVDFQIGMGVHGFTILGVLGEASKLSVTERKLVVDTVVEVVDGRVPVVVGTSRDDVKVCIELSMGAVAAGATGVMIAPPYFDSPVHDPNEVMDFYAEIANHYYGPIVVQDFPPVNNVFMSPDYLAVISEKIPNARHLKLEGPPLLQKIHAIQARTKQLRILGGSGGTFFLEELKRGASGTMTGFAFSEMLVAVFDMMKNGSQDEATQIFDRFTPLIRFENQPGINLTIRKELLYRRGAIAYPSPREPFVAIDSGTHQEIQWVLKRVGIDDPTQKLNFQGDS